jgi:ATP-dependent Clp protease ATP-binding subunit ClpC
MFERFTDGARQVVVLAQEEARLLRHNYIGTEHILLGLLRADDSAAARALESLGVSLAQARTEVEAIIGRGRKALSGHIPFTPRAKRVLELSLSEAKRLRHQHIGTEHILLGLLREGEGVGAQVLVRLGVDLNKARLAVKDLALGSPGADLPPASLNAGARRRVLAPADFAARLDALEAEVDRLRTLLRDRGIDEADDSAGGAT